MSLSKDTIVRALKAVPAPGGDAVSAGWHQWTAICDGLVSVKLAVPADLGSEGRAAISRQILGEVTRAAAADRAPFEALTVEFVDHAGTVIQSERMSPASRAPSHEPIRGLGPTPDSGSKAPTPQGGAPALPNVKHVIAVGAGKGGVGKSTVALNLAVGLARRGHAVGLMDADIYGPSLPTMLDLHATETIVHSGMLQPFYVHGVKAMTMGKLVEPDKPLIWRGPMAHGAFKQLVERTNWGELDYFIIDLPPGTGDVSLTMAQTLQLSGAVVVCTPQKVAQDDAVRAARMFQQLGIDVLGVVENMSSFIGDDGKRYDIFGRGGAEQMAQRLGVPFLGALPITMALRKNSDDGNPTANFTGGGPLLEALDAMVTNVEKQVALASLRSGRARPTLKIS